MTRLYITKIREHEYLLNCPELGIERELLNTKHADYYEVAIQHVTRITQAKLASLQ